MLEVEGTLLSLTLYLPPVVSLSSIQTVILHLNNVLCIVHNVIKPQNCC